VIAWERVRVPTLCGRCGRALAIGDPICVFVVGPHHVRKVRCDRCEGPAPPELPPHLVTRREIEPRPLVRLKPVLLPFRPLADFRARQAGEREPGEDG
jgi:hypothetical protein